MTLPDHTIIDLPFSLHDGRIVEFTRTANSLRVHIQTWNTAQVEIHFLAVIAIQEWDAVGASLEDMRESYNSDYLHFIKQQMLQVDCSEEELSSLRHFVITNLDERPVLQIICTSFALSNDVRP